MRADSNRETEWMLRYCEGDSSAFRALYDSVAPRLHAYLVRLARDRALADDILQDVFLKIHEARANYVRGADPVPWFYAITHRTFVDRVRTSTRHQRLSAELEHNPTPGDDEAPDDEQRLARVRAALGRLSATQRAAFELTKLERMKPAAAARVLGTSEGAVKVRAHRALATLRQRFAGEAA